MCLAATAAWECKVRMFNDMAPLGRLANDFSTLVPAPICDL